MRSPCAAAVLVLALGTSCGRSTAADPRDRPAPFDVPDFSLPDQSGAPVARTSLLGRPWVADFVYLECGDLCPILNRSMVALQKAAAGRGVAFVSFSVWAAHRPDALQRYLQRNFPKGSDPRWHLLAADGKSFPRLAKAAGLVRSEEEVREGFAATSRYLFLVDAAGHARTAYDGTDDAEVARLARDLDTLLLLPPPLDRSNR